MDNNKYGYLVIGLLVGVVVAWFFAYTAVNQNNSGMMRMMGMRSFENQKQSYNYSNRMSSMHGGHMEEAMDGMMANLENKTGDSFDSAFIDEMILHHRGAIEMANLAIHNAKHQEIRDLAKAIIEAQSKEISTMTEWKAQWYK